MSAAAGLPVHALYFHDMSQERWLSPGEAFFVPVQKSPMGFNWGATSSAAPDALRWPASPTGW